MVSVITYLLSVNINGKEQKKRLKEQATFTLIEIYKSTVIFLHASHYIFAFNIILLKLN